MRNKDLKNGLHDKASMFRPVKVLFAALAVLCFFLPFAAKAQTYEFDDHIPLILGDSESHYFLGAYTYLIPDPDEKFTAQEILEKAKNLSLSQRNTRDIIDLGYLGEKKWLVFKLHNTSSETDWLLNFGSTLEGRYGFLDKIDIYSYIPQPLVSAADTKEGVLTPITKRLDKTIPLTLEKDQEVILIMPLQSTSGVPLTLNLQIQTRDFSILQGENLLGDLNILMMFLAGMAFFFLSVCLSKRSWNYLPFSVYYAVLVLLFHWNNVSVFSLLPLRGEILPLLMGLLAVGSVGLTKVFLDIRKYDYTERYTLNGLALLVFVCGTAGLLPLETNPLIKTALFYGPIVFTFTVLPLLCFAQAQIRKDEAYPLIWAWLFLLAGIIISAAALSGFLSLSGITVNAFWIMLFPQAIFFISATLKRIERQQDILFEEKAQENKETLSLVRLRHTKESAEQNRLLKVIEKERQLLAQMREREARRTEEMRVAKTAADEANRAKSAFLAVVSHEIRTPMTGIMGMVRLLLDGNLSKEQKDYVMTIQDSGDAMLTLLNDILDFEKIERGKMDLEYISFDLPRLIQGIARLMSGHAAQKNVGLKVNIEDSVPRYVMGDPNRLRQILLNLTSNAIKFTSEGDVTLHLRAEKGETDKDYNIYYAVHDSGIGIAQDVQEYLFTPFAQADSSISRKFGGTGLGLAICKGLIEAMGSVIRVSSEEGHGSTFFFTLQMERAKEEGETESSETQESPPPAAAAPLDAKHVLVVDDNEINKKVILGFLDKMNCSAETAQSAEQAIEMIKTGTYDVVLMDIQLPNMKGDEATMVIRQMEDVRKASLPVIALSGNVLQEDIERFYQAGMDGYVAKPIDPAKLEKAVMSSRPHVAPSPGAPAEETKDITSESGIFDAEMLGVLRNNLGETQLQELLDGLIVKTQEIVEALVNASKEKDMNEIAARAHDLKGMAGNFGLSEISTMAENAEKIAKGSPPDAAPPQEDLNELISSLPDASLRAKEALKSWMRA
ncbi:MAG: response regulator [Rhodospirillales bacterium]|nr:response regulator [Alphaproteobacteria bacterium]USO04458.1 MAG: response regulator [Rhodospirillales bacterium]